MASIHGEVVADDAAQANSTHNGVGKKCAGFDNFVLEIVIDPEARIVNNAGSVERNKLI